MNSQSNAISESHVESVAIAPAAIPLSRRLYWSVRRELWESRSVYIAPLAVAALILVGFLISMFHLPGTMRAALALNPAQQHQLIEKPYSLAGLMLMAISFIVAMFYCLDALHSERRDRSILFWKSLPVSDLTTVLSKLTIPLLVIPLVTFAVTVATHWTMLLLNSAVLLASGLSVTALWSHLSLAHMWLMLLYHLVAIHGLWYLPIYGWLLLVSAWSRRAPFLWAVLPPLAIAVVEKIAFNTSHFVHFMGYIFSGGSETSPLRAGGSAMDRLMQPTLGQLLTSPGLWIGLAVAAAFIAGAVRLRRYRGPI
jgi:ABC-2 type transport system permease protein